mmetsp:Transcript_111851/g.311293  ORF Transcript_111851/g.311293 Transcript_111851/m.311293 type:complete len:261 (+) Transcript_111851:1226-2008(+)
MVHTDPQAHLSGKYYQEDQLNRLEGFWRLINLRQRHVFRHDTGIDSVADDRKRHHALEPDTGNDALRYGSAGEGACLTLHVAEAVCSEVVVGEYAAPRRQGPVRFLCSCSLHLLVGNAGLTIDLWDGVVRAVPRPGPSRLEILPCGATHREAGTGRRPLAGSLDWQHRYVTARAGAAGAPPLGDGAAEATVEFRTEVRVQAGGEHRELGFQLLARKALQLLTDLGARDAHCVRVLDFSHQTLWALAEEAFARAGRNIHLS